MGHQLPISGMIARASYLRACYPFCMACNGGRAANNALLLLSHLFDGLQNAITALLEVIARISYAEIHQTACLAASGIVFPTRQVVDYKLH